MCGIVGFLGSGNQDIITHMAESTHYRGPDFTGAFYDDSHQIGLGHNRLSIIDLSAPSNQPFFSSDKRYAIVFNGEIYNYQALKKDLITGGYTHFHTQGDTEVLLAAYIVYGKKCLELLNGMFSFAIYDFQERKLFAARDRFGEKPFYYFNKNGLFAFSSEPKAILKHPKVEKKLNLDALNHYLTLDYIPSPLSIYEDIQRLPAAHYLEIDSKCELSIAPYYQCTFNEVRIDKEEAKTKLEDLLDQSTKLKLNSDVPLGVFLSGGLDSSTVAYFAQKNHPGQINTFAIGFDEKSYDERAYGQLVADHLGTKHHVMTLTAKDSLDLIPNVFSTLDEPFADPSILPTYLLSKFTRSKVTVALGGDGSDELFSGYPTFISEKLLKQFPFQIAISSSLNTLLKILPNSDKNISLDFKIKQFLKGLGVQEAYRHPNWLGSFNKSEKNRLIRREVLSKNSLFQQLSVIDKLWEETSTNKITKQYINTYLQDDILFKVDRASMFNSLEVRAPFLDHQLVDFVNSLPSNLKLKGFSNVKYLLKETMRGKLPTDIIDRPKKGFGIPLSLWLRNELKPLCGDLLSESNLKSQGIFDAAYVQNLKDDHFAGKKNNRKELWNLLVFQMWYQGPFGLH